MLTGIFQDFCTLLKQAKTIQDAMKLEQMAKERREKLIRAERSEWAIQKIWLTKQASNHWTAKKGATKYVEKHGEHQYSMSPTKMDDPRVRWFQCKLHAEEFMAHMRADQPESFESRFAEIGLVSRKKQRH